MIVIAIVVGAVDAWVFVPPRAGTTAEVRQAIIALELDEAPVWPADLVGARHFSAATAAAVQAGYLRRVSADSTGKMLGRMRLRDYPTALLHSVRDQKGVYMVAGSGNIVSYDFRRRLANGDLVVRAAVQNVLETARWDPRTRSLVAAHTDAGTKAVICDYTLHKEDGVWKVADRVGLRFLDIRTGTVTDPP